MKQAFAFVFVLAVLFFGIAQGTLKEQGREGVVTLTWATDPNPARNFQLSGFAEMFPGYEVVVDQVQGGDLTKVIVRCATNTGPDLIDLYHTRHLSTAVESGIALDLTPYAEEMGFGPSNVWPSVQAALEVDGRQYRYPCNIATSNMLFNKRIFDELDIPYPQDGWTWDDLEEIGALIRERSAGGREYIPLTGMGLHNLLASYGADFFDETGLYSQLDSPEAIAALERRRSLMFDSKTIPTGEEAAATSSDGGWGQGELRWFASGNAAMMAIGRWFLIQLPQYPDLGPELGVVQMPRAEGRHSQSSIDTRAAAVNALSPNKDDALKFLQYLASEEYTNIILQDNDGLPPNPRFVQSGEDMVNEMMPDAEFQQAFLDAVPRARAFRTSRFIDLGQVDRWMSEAQGEVDTEQKSAEQAMTELAREINVTIQRDLARRPDLQELFLEATGFEWTPDWTERFPRPEYEAPPAPYPFPG